MFKYNLKPTKNPPMPPVEPPAKPRCTMPPKPRSKPPTKLFAKSFSNIDMEDIKRLEKYEDYLWSLGNDATEEEKKDLQSFKKVITALRLINLKENSNEIS